MPKRPAGVDGAGRPPGSLGMRDHDDRLPWARMASTTVTPARRAAHAVVRRTLVDGAVADRALHGEARGLDVRERALAKQLAFGAVQRRLTLDHVIDEHVDRKLEP